MSTSEAAPEAGPEAAPEAAPEAGPVLHELAYRVGKLDSLPEQLARFLDFARFVESIDDDDLRRDRSARLAEDARCALESVRQHVRHCEAAAEELKAIIEALDTA